MCLKGGGGWSSVRCQENEMGGGGREGIKLSKKCP